MIENVQKTLFMDVLCDKKEELEELRHLLNESIEATGFTDYQEILAISRKMDEAVIEYIKQQGSR